VRKTKGKSSPKLDHKTNKPSVPAICGETLGGNLGDVRGKSSAKIDQKTKNKPAVPRFSGEDQRSDTGEIKGKSSAKIDHQTKTKTAATSFSGEDQRNDVRGVKAEVIASLMETREVVLVPICSPVLGTTKTSIGFGDRWMTWCHASLTGSHRG